MCKPAEELAKQRYPLLLSIAESEVLKKGFGLAEELLAHEDKPIKALRKIEQEKDLPTGLLMEVLCPTTGAFHSAVADNIEKDLQILAAVLDIDVLHRVYSSKLLTTKVEQWQDAVYEVAVAAMCSGFVTPGTLTLEHALPGTAKNSDISGTLNGRTLRVEVTVLHEQWPPLSADGEPKIYSRSMMDPHEAAVLDAYRPKGMITTSDILRDCDTHNQNPVSTKIWQKLDEKRKQCEEGAVNVVVFGVPCRVNDDDVRDAVFGARHAAVSEHGARLVRYPSGPFILREESIDSRQLVEPFQIMSAVWLLRVNHYDSASEVLLNPNAQCPLTHEEVANLQRRGTCRQRGEEG